MGDFLRRAHAPLTVEEWEALDRLVAETAQKQVVGRRILNVFGPLGAGVQYVSRSVLGAAASGGANSPGQGGAVIEFGAASQVPLALIRKDFVLSWRDIEATRQTGLPLDLGAAAAAAAMCAAREDDLIFNGDKTLGVEGLTTAAGQHTTTRRDWGVGGHAFLDVADALAVLAGAGFYAPYALVASPNLYACLLRTYGDSGALEISQVRELCEGGVFQSVALTTAVVLALGPQNFDLAVGQDMTVAYVSSQGMDHVFWVLETVALRIKRGGAICVLRHRTASPGHRVRRGVPEEAVGIG